ncbi:universal stress protein [Brenneria izbisi]|uniref:Universal stress protein n=1 Tax=Brenneria izbisi TaxID=2939450 RepID=A0AA42C2Q7_9GAMM|nr:universal stress protein [Brenneria izbisi]MCV9877745.1 universal stress protein [Brenneria izbisi]MCV9880690.1 universal stress protein [Brenneria izbisi]
MYSAILVPVDITEEQLTRNALTHAVRLAKMSNATIHLFHALPDASAFLSAYSFGMKEFENEAVVKANDKLKALAKSIDLPASHVSFSVSFGTPRDEALQLAEELNADLIVIGSRRPDVKTYLLGSNAAAIVRHAKTSVLVIR